MVAIISTMLVMGDEILKTAETRNTRQHGGGGHGRPPHGGQGGHVGNGGNQFGGNSGHGRPPQGGSHGGNQYGHGGGGHGR